MQCYFRQYEFPWLNENESIQVMSSLADEQHVAPNHLTKIITGSSEGRLTVLNFNIPNVQVEYHLRPYDLPVTTIAAYIPMGGNEDGYLIFAGFPNGVVYRWNLTNPNNHFHINCHSRIQGIASHWNSGFIAVALQDKRIAVWYVDLQGNQVPRDPNNPFQITFFPTPHTDQIFGVAIVCPINAVNGQDAFRKIITAGWDKTMILWERNEQNAFTLFPSHHLKKISVVYVHYPTGEERVEYRGINLPIIITGSLDQKIIIWDYRQRVPVRTLHGHTGEIKVIKVFDRNDDGSPPIIISGSDDRSIILWDMLSGIIIRKITYQERILNLFIIGSSDGLIVGTTGESSNLKVWDLRRIQRVKEFACTRNFNGVELDANITTINVIHTRILNPIAAHPLPANQVENPNAPAEVINALHHLPENPIIPEQPENPQEIRNQILVGCVDNSFRLFNYPNNEHNNGERIQGRAFDHFHQSRINAVAMYQAQPNADQPNPDLYVISADGQAKVKRWRFADLQNGENQEFGVAENRHNGTVMAIGSYDPYKFGFSYARERRELANTALILTGGSDRHIKVWDLEAMTLLHTIDQAHDGMIRSIVVYHPVNRNIHPLFISGSYDRRAILWDLITFEPLRVYEGVHEDCVFFIGFYNPAMQLNQLNDNENENLQVVTTSHDAKIAIWSRDNNPPRVIVNAHEESITALVIYTPKRIDSVPLIITGSIDRLIHIWNFQTLEKVYTLGGHKDRVCWLAIGNIAGVLSHVLFSGGDDGQVLAHEDVLYSEARMPVRDDVYRLYEHDRLNTRGKWPLLDGLVQQHGSGLILENSNLFSQAIIDNRADFLFQFWNLLLITLPTIQLKNGLDLLSLAIDRGNLPAVRIILLAWLRILNKDMDSILTQRVYHGMYFFPLSAIKLLALKYPLEFIHFITSLRLIHVSSTLVDEMPEEEQDRVLISPRFEVKGSSRRNPQLQELWNNEEQISSFSDSFQWGINHILHASDQCYQYFFDNNTIAQPVITLMMPIQMDNHILTYYAFLELFINVSDRTNNVEVFDSEVVIIILHYFWMKRGRHIHTFAFIQYVMFLCAFLLCMYTYDSHYENHQAGEYFLSILMIGFFGYYAYEEMDQWYGMTKHLQQKEPLLQYAGIYHFQDIWNCVDVGIIIAGILGLILRLGYQSDTPTGRAMLAITSVLMWFKFLYFLRPYAITGPLVAMILDVIREMSTFLLVLFCVLAGFAQALWLLSNNDTDAVFGTISQSFLNTFLYMLGQNVVADFTGTDSPYMATIFLIVFLIVMMILMLNLLIALMGDVFSKAREQRLALWRKERARMILEESYRFINDDRLPAYLYVLKYTSEVIKDPINYEELFYAYVRKSNVRPFKILDLDDER